ncbi:MAG: HD domain-containing protein [Calditrichaeota bacterium]|nr:HD domain-containing protein [Calditrichota bacterium]
MLTRDQALALVETKITTGHLFKHSLAVENVMRDLALRLNQDENLFSLTGLLHDLDADITAGEPDKHTLITCSLLKGLVPEIVSNAILAHNHKHPAETTLDKALLCADPVTGLITAAVLMHPSRKLTRVETPFLKKRFKEKRFAAGASREQIAGCAELGLNLEEFLELSLKAMQKIAPQLGL